jgi:hypothetical protein
MEESADRSSGKDEWRVFEPFEGHVGAHTMMQ